METKPCPQCGAPMEGNRCDFCGYVETAAPAAPAAPAAASGQAPAAATPKKADFLFDKADFLDAAGQVKLGLMYLNGVGVEKDAAAAADLFRKAADGGDRDGMFRYAEALESGAGVPQDRDRARRYFVEAGRLGHPGARTRLKDYTDAELGVVPEKQAVGSFEQVVSKVRPFCVEFTCFSDGIPVSQGSGCVLDGGIILTNAHVISDLNKTPRAPFDMIFVNFDEKFDSGKYLVEAMIVDFDEDIALCAFAGGEPRLPAGAPQLNPEADIVPGKEVFTVGNGLGRGLGVSRGVISRDVERNAYGHREVIRTDMSVNPGNSGGALFDMEGSILGIMTFVATQNDRSLAYGMSYAVTAGSVVDLLMRVRAELGDD